MLSWLFRNREFTCYHVWCQFSNPHMAFFSSWKHVLLVLEAISRRGCPIHFSCMSCIVGLLPEPHVMTCSTPDRGAVWRVPSLPWARLSVARQQWSVWWPCRRDSLCPPIVGALSASSVTTVLRHGLSWDWRECGRHSAALHQTLNWVSLSCFRHFLLPKSDENRKGKCPELRR